MKTFLNMALRMACLAVLAFAGGARAQDAAAEANAIAVRVIHHLAPGAVQIHRINPDGSEGDPIWVAPTAEEAKAATFAAKVIDEALFWKEADEAKERLATSDAKTKTAQELLDAVKNGDYCPPNGGHVR